MEFWQHIYSHFNPVAFELFGLKVHWYGIMYILALLSALWFAKVLIKKDNLPISNEILDKFFVYVEIGVILGARIGYFLFYSEHLSYYLIHPWQMFNPFGVNGEYIGIRGMSFHGAVIGFSIGAYLFSRKYKGYTLKILDVASVAIPLGYIFGRIGNFLNQELFGRVTDVPWGIYVHGVLRHPSQLYEAFLEGFVIFVIMMSIRSYKKFDGQLILIYMILYALMRSISETFRQPDPQLGYICCGWLTMGQLLSFCMVLFAGILYVILSKRQKVESS